MILINKRFPRIRLLTQFMVGFPTETEEDFRLTEGLLDHPASFDFVYIFKFSRRPRVYASYIAGQVPEHIKEYRRRRLLRRYAYAKSLSMMAKGAHGIF
jgi:tRNA A37 methylthiotransferase MiaB